jgi:putative PIN family toxin of toxin-antitoxin system
VRLVLDTCVIVSAFRSRRGASRQLIDALDANRYSVLLSQALLLEYEAVLTRPEQMEAHGLSSQQVSEFLDNFIHRSIRVSFDRRLRPQLRDPNDELVLETAVNGFADAIVTHNVKDLLPALTLFGIPVSTPRAIIRERFRL